MTSFETPQNNEITYLEADINYTIFHLSGGKRIISSFTLKKYERDSRLAGFLRVHKSFLLNPDFIKHYEQHGKTATIQLSTGKILSVSRRRIGHVKNKIALKMLESRLC